MKSICILCCSLFLSTAAFNQDSSYEQMIEYSRPNKNHLLLGAFVGKWAFQDAKLAFVKGTVTCQPFYDGRFYRVEITGGKLPLPIAGNAMKEDNYHELRIEGYDNGRKQFVSSIVNNHIGSDIQTETGSYDEKTKTFTYAFVTELVPGNIMHNQRVIKWMDDNHYAEQYFEVKDGKPVAVRVLNYTRLTDK